LAKRHALRDEALREVSLLGQVALALALDLRLDRAAAFPSAASRA
jgi:hypothetical protein